MKRTALLVDLAKSVAVCFEHECDLDPDEGICNCDECSADDTGCWRCLALRALAAYQGRSSAPQNLGTDSNEGKLSR